ncbi:zinc-dependent alcohol dehydrogenase [Diplocloster agilis]|uniref:zinc-dependent alcohol dehydrogenase n=1 Tax=Diplocloster agilis TaxID=2850323 RepID=UPI001DD96890|nr:MULTISPECIES: alcohol dehydrogenase catalytic domain-containing protein [Lachnospiraceae]MBU9744758.1 alcohol dehydrogenase catalytic domain-containing protein [Diplocloster agilis]MCU6734683.1 alcohol dehydrogenase catalytic domain-containing protein [Suonthocola fibrivorans]
MKKTMKAYRVTAPLKMELQEVPVPVLNDNEVLVRVKAMGICTTDIELYDGSMPYYREGLSRMPLTIGHEWSGYVAAMGSQVTGFSVGDLVVGDISIGCGKCENCLRGMYHLCSQRTELGVIRYDGSMAEYLKTEGKNLYKVPEGVTWEEAAVTEPTATALYGVKKTGLNPGDRVAVIGDGSIGMLAAQIANCSGAGRVCLVARKDMHREKVNGWGIDLVVHGQEDLKGQVETALGGPADVVFEASGNAAAYEDAIRLVRPGGKICAMSITGKEQISMDMDYIVTRDITVVGMLASPNSFAPALRLIAAKKVDAAGCISHRFLFDQSVEALEFVRMKAARDKIKVLIVHDNEKEGRVEK